MEIKLGKRDFEDLFDIENISELELVTKKVKVKKIQTFS